MRQLLFMLYQLRNNIVHGGSAAFLYDENRIYNWGHKVIGVYNQTYFRTPRVVGAR